MDSGECMRSRDKLELQEKGGKEYFAEVASILVNGAEKPGDVEAPRHVGQCGAPCHQHDPAVTDRLKLSLGHQGGARRMRRLNNHFAVAEFPEQQETAVAQRSDRRHRRGFEPFPTGNAFPRLKTEILGAAQHFRNADPSSAEAMTDLLRIRPDAVQSQQHHQNGETWITSGYAVSLGNPVKHEGALQRSAVVKLGQELLPFMRPSKFACSTCVRGHRAQNSQQLHPGNVE